MRIQPWTLALAVAASVGAPAAQAEEHPSPILSAVSATTISGYVDTSAQWNPGSGNVNLPPYKFGGAGKADGFDLDVVQLSLEKPIAADTDQWATGYHVDLWAGPDADTLNTQSLLASAKSDFALRQAYLALRLPIGNGLDWKIGVFDSILGYESVASPANANFTRSYGHSIEPQTLTGILARYQVTENLLLQAGVADTFGPAVNERAQGPNLAGVMKPESYKTCVVAFQLVAPESMGFLANATLAGGLLNGFSSQAATLANPRTGAPGNGDVTSWYLGATMNPPVKGLKLGMAFDYLDIYGDAVPGQTWSLAGYASWQIPDSKLSLHARAEYFKDSAGFFDITALDANGNTAVSFGDPQRTMALTGTVQYDLWKNVLGRFELRWDHALSGQGVWGGTAPDGPLMSNGSSGTLRNEWLLAANVIYVF
jgi:hypothetical protein